jgi:hypothetical protein
MDDERIVLFWVMYETTDGVGHYTEPTLNEEEAWLSHAALKTRTDVRAAALNYAEVRRSELDAIIVK